MCRGGVSGGVAEAQDASQTLLLRVPLVVVTLVVGCGAQAGGGARFRRCHIHAGAYT